ncbi:hypothetical protein [Thalassobaculum sp.]|uniref:hypothetical protein n=1 Tax=Thalassobaculum sp. TaxID=2022740 RepID=UPI0032EEF300
MTVSTGPTEAPRPSLAHDLLGLARHYLGRRRVLLVLAGLALAAGLALNWGWLTAAGIAPILVSLLPCAAMCGLGLCMSKGGGKSCSAGAMAPDAAPDAKPAVPVDPSDTTTDQIPTGAVVASLADAEPQPPKEWNTTDA